VFRYGPGRLLRPGGLCMEGGLLATGMRSLPRNRPTWRREGTVAAVVCAVAFGHFVTPAGLHEWHWLHILLQKLFYLPILVVLISP
jgi:hypothetical protein